MLCYNTDDLSKVTQPAVWQSGFRAGSRRTPQVPDPDKCARRKEFQNLAYWAEFFPLTNELASPWPSTNTHNVGVNNGRRIPRSVEEDCLEGDARH